MKVDERTLVSLYGPARSERRDSAPTVADSVKEIRSYVEKIGNVANSLDELRGKLDGKADKGLLTDVEKRITDKLAELFEGAQSAELRKLAAEAYNEQSAAILEKLDKVETLARRAGGGAQNDANEFVEQHRAAFRDLVRLGGREVPDEQLSERLGSFLRSDEYRTLTMSVGSEGGFLLPAPTETDLDKNITEMDPVRSLARVQSGTSPTLRVMRRTSIPTGGNAGEQSKTTASNSAYGEIKIDAEPMDVYLKATRDFLADVNGAETEILADAAEEMARLEGYNFVLGDGVEAPHGFMNDDDTSVSQDTTTGNVTADALIGLYTDLKTFYADRSTYAFNRTTLKTILQLKDSQNNYLWNFVEGFANGVPKIICGRPWVIFPNMADEGADTKPVILADWYSYYRIYDRSGVEVTRDPYTSKPLVEFLVRKRVGGRVIRAEAGKIMRT